jgi:hypothetical protein
MSTFKFVLTLTGVVLLIWCIQLVAKVSAPKSDLSLPVAELLPAAERRDPFACGQGLRASYPVRERHQELYRRFAAACCSPPVEDLAGFVRAYCPSEGGR